VHELGVYLPFELLEGEESAGPAGKSSAARSQDGDSYDQLTSPQRRRRGQPLHAVNGPLGGASRVRNGSGSGAASGGGRGATAGAETKELAEALRELDVCAAAGRAAVAAAEGDYGSRMIGRRGGGGGGRGAAPTVAIPVLSPVASSYGSGGHYLYEEGMANEDDEGGKFEGSYGSASNDDADDDEEADGTAAPSVGVDATVDGGAAPESRYPDKVGVGWCLRWGGRKEREKEGAARPRSTSENCVACRYLYLRFPDLPHFLPALLLPHNSAR
jgi:hypothetical protein